jgi:hypothetical protein
MQARDLIPFRWLVLPAAGNAGRWAFTRIYGENNCMSDTEDLTASLKIDEHQVEREQVEDVIALHVMRAKENIHRVTNLVTLWLSLKRSTEFSSNTAVDEILRASVVFTHATLEDFLRTLAAKLLPEAGEQILNQIPLIGMDTPSGRAEKFSLGRLAKLKGQTVDQVIADSVSKYLEHSNFNNVKDIVVLLESLNLDVSQVSSSFPKIEELMSRRHLIVHRADRVGSLSNNQKDVLEIDGETVLGWLQETVKFIEAILRDAATKHMTVKR